MNQQIETPTFNEWLVLIQENSAQSNEILSLLQTRISQDGANNAPTSAIMSLRGYHRAIDLIESAASDILKEQELLRETKIGLRMPGPYPNKGTWQNLIEEDPINAQNIVHALELKAASFGLMTTEELRQSIDDYYVVTSM